MFLKCSCQKLLKKHFGRPVFLKELQATISFSKISLHFKNILDSLGQVLQTYSEKCIFLCAAEKRPPQAVGKNWSQSTGEIFWWNWWRCDGIHIMLNLSQKCEGNLGYWVLFWDIFGVYLGYNFSKCYNFINNII